MKQVGITGGIGSGKSTVCKIFETLKVPVFYADNEAKILMNSNEILKTEITNTFGKDVYKNNDLDRKKLAQLVFNNPEALSKLNALVHPKVGVAYQSWLQKQNHPFVLKEAAILFESGSNKNLDEINCPKCSKISPSKKIVTTKSGRQIGYTSLISTIPLPVYVKLIEELPHNIANDCRKLKWTTVDLTSVAISREVDFPLWFYI